MTTDWGRARVSRLLALARMERGRFLSVRSSLLSVPGHVVWKRAVFSVVGEVMGCIVEDDRVHRLGWLRLRRVRTG